MLEASLQWMGLGLCHQLPERSLFGGGIQAPVCARDTGIYIGFVLALVLIALLHRRERPRGFPAPWVWAAMGVALAAMAWDGVTSYAGFRETTNTLRVLTGVGVGFSIAALLVPMLNDELWLDSGPGRVLDPLWKFAAWLVAMPLVSVLILVGGGLFGVGFIVFSAVCILVTLTCVNLVLVAMLPWFDRRVSAMRGLIAPVAIAFVLASAQIAAAAWLRLFLDRLALGLAS